MVGSRLAGPVGSVASSGFFVARFGVLGAFVHELVEFRLVLCVAQTLEEGFKSVLFIFEAAQRFCLVGVKRVVSTRFEGVVRVTGAAAAISCEHAFAPDHIGEKGEADRPEKDEAKNRGNDPRGLAAFVEPPFAPAKPVVPVGGRGCYRRGVHFVLLLFWVNVNAFHITDIGRAELCVNGECECFLHKHTKALKVIHKNISSGWVRPSLLRG